MATIAIAGQRQGKRKLFDRFGPIRQKNSTCRSIASSFIAVIAQVTVMQLGRNQ